MWSAVRVQWSLIERIQWASEGFYRRWDSVLLFFFFFFLRIPFSHRLHLAYPASLFPFVTYTIGYTVALSISLFISTFSSNFWSVLHAHTFFSLSFFR